MYMKTICNFWLKLFFECANCVHFTSVCLCQQLDTEKESIVPLISRTLWTTRLQTTARYVVLSSAKFSLESLHLVLEAWKYCLKNLQESVMTPPSMTLQIRRYLSCSPIITCIPSILSHFCHVANDWLMYWLTFSRALLHFVSGDICRSSVQHRTPRYLKYVIGFHWWSIFFLWSIYLIYA
jgi:hypothetical protein